jgi:hypothetical protein
MRRIKSGLALFAVLVVLLSSATPANAQGWDDNWWWDSCEWTWHWNWWWGWFLTCDYNPGWQPVSNGWEPVNDDWEPSGPHGG